MPKTQHKEHQADPVTKKADPGRDDERYEARQRRTASERQREIDGTARQTFDHRDLQRIGGAKLAGEVVIDTPGDASEDDQYAAPAELRACAHRSRPGEQDRAGKDRHRAQEDAAIDILPKHNSGDCHRGEALSIEQQGSGRGRRERQAPHEQGGAENAAEQHKGAKPG